VKDFGLKLGVIIGESMAEKQVGPLLEGMIANYLVFSDEAMLPPPLDVAIDFKAQLVGLDISTTGLQIRGDVDLTSKFPAASCLRSDPGAPAVVAGAAPALGAGTPSDVAVAVTFGLVRDALSHLWHEGLLCITPGSLPADMQATLKTTLGQLGTMLPGFPSG